MIIHMVVSFLPSILGYFYLYISRNASANSSKHKTPKAVLA